MADFDSLEKQIEVLAQATAKGFDSVNGRLDVLETDVKDVKENLVVVNQKLERIERELNERPRKRHGWLTPLQVWSGALQG